MIEEDNYRLVEAQLKKFKNKDFDKLPKWVQKYLLTHEEKKYEPGFSPCRHCNGRGHDSYLVRIPESRNRNRKLEWRREPCRFCDGTGQISWLENLFSKGETIEIKNGKNSIYYELSGMEDSEN